MKTIPYRCGMCEHKFLAYADPLNCPKCESDEIEPSTQKVIFRASRRKNPEISAVLVGQPGSPTAPLCAWDSTGGHSSATWDWYYSTRPAKPSEYADELQKLQKCYAPEYEIKVVQKHSRRS
jgi:hypothetical protein